MRDLPLGGLRIFQTVRSTNDEALAWAAQAAPDASLVVSDEQTAGRGRAGRTWYTPRSAALAFSLILRPAGGILPDVGRLTGLGALALSDGCDALHLDARIKWPNDVLLAGRKVGGILVESVWSGNELEASVVGIGINVTADSIPPIASLAFPATCMEREVGGRVDREILLHDVVASLLRRRSRLAQDEFIQEWAHRLAYVGQPVVLTGAATGSLYGTLLGLETDGSLRVDVGGRPVTVHVGEVQLRPSDDKIA